MLLIPALALVNDFLHCPTLQSLNLSPNNMNNFKNGTSRDYDRCYGYEG